VTLKDEIRGFEDEIVGFSETGNQPTKCPAKLPNRGQCPGIFRAPRRPQEAKEAGRALAANGGFLNLLPIKQPKM